jgi:hypothetical protein
MRLQPETLVFTTKNHGTEKSGFYGLTTINRYKRDTFG